MIIEQPARFLRWLYPHATWRMDPSVKAVYLTFDDGPIPEATPFVLDTLARYGIKATFFVVGDNVHKYPELFHRIIAEGHRVGNHTYNHIGGFRWLSRNYLRNTKKAHELMIEELTKMNTTDSNQASIINQLLARNGSIITFHDSLRSIDKLHVMLPTALEWLLAQGYEFRLFN